MRVDARTLDLGGRVSHQTLGALCNLLDHEPIVQTAVRQQFPNDHQWLLGVLPQQLRKLALFRNAGAHSGITGADELAKLRRWVVGVGEEGLVGRLVRAGMRGR